MELVETNAGSAGSAASVQFQVSASVAGCANGWAVWQYSGNYIYIPIWATASQITGILAVNDVPWVASGGPIQNYGTPVTLTASSPGSIGSDPFSLNATSYFESGTSGNTWTLQSDPTCPNPGDAYFAGGGAMYINTADSDGNDHSGDISTMSGNSGYAQFLDGTTFAQMAGQFSGGSGPVLFNANALYPTTAFNVGDALTVWFGWYVGDSNDGQFNYFSDGTSAVQQQFSLTLTNANAGAWQLGPSSGSSMLGIPYDDPSSSIQAAFLSQGWPVASVAYVSGSGDASANAVYAVTWTAGNLTGTPAFNIGSLNIPPVSKVDSRLNYLDAAVSSRSYPGSQQDLVDSPNAMAVNIFVFGIWEALISNLNHVTNSFGWLFSTKLAAISGQIAAQSDVQVIQNNTTISLSLPPAIQIPSSGSTAYPLTIYLRNSAGVMVNVTSGPTVTVKDPAGNSYAARLSSITNAATGKYTFTATINSTDTEVLLIWEVTASTSEGTQIIGGQSWVTQQVMAYFTTTDRSTLNATAASASTAATDAAAIATTIGTSGAGLTALGDTRIGTINTNAATASTQAANAATSAATAVTQTGSSAVAAAVQTGLANQGYTATRAGYLDALHVGVVLAANGLDSVLIESGITASSSLTNDSGTRLTALNARQALAVLASACASIATGANGTTVTYWTAGNPSGNARITAEVDSFGDRSMVTLNVPV